MKGRGLIDQSVEGTEYIKMEFSSHHLSEEKIEVLFDGVSLLLFAEDVPILHWEVMNTVQRRDCGRKYFKIHGIKETLCLVPEQKTRLETLLLCYREKASFLVARDFNTKKRT